MIADPLANAFATLDRLPRRQRIAALPTPVEMSDLDIGGGRVTIAVKRDDLTSDRYGGNKVRKLEYIFARAIDRGASRVATFGSVSSHHALATAIYARDLGMGCTCLLSHQTKTPRCAETLARLLAQTAEIHCYGRDYAERVAMMRATVQGRGSWVIPMGGTSWLGSIGYVRAALEFAAQVDAGIVPAPDRVYVAAGTLGTAVGLALGLALARQPATVHAVRVTHPTIVNRAVLSRLLGKTASMMRHYDRSIPADLASGARIVLRESFAGPGYGKPTRAAQRAVEVAGSALGLALETTYTGKALAALLADLTAGDTGRVLFWNTYNSAPLPAPPPLDPDDPRLPEPFLHYLR